MISPNRLRSYALALLICLSNSAIVKHSASYTSPYPRRTATRPTSLWSASSSSSVSSSATVIAPEKKDDAIIAFCSQLGGDLRRIRLPGEDPECANRASVPIFAAVENASSSSTTNSDVDVDDVSPPTPRRLGLEAAVPGAFLLENVVSREDCEAVLRVCEDELGFGTFRSGDNPPHGALQIVVSRAAADRLARAIERHAPRRLRVGGDEGGEEVSFRGANRRWRVYRYAPGGRESFAPHVDAGFPGSGLTDDGTELVWDVHDPEPVVSRRTVLLYLNDDFSGGRTRFYEPRADVPDGEDPETIASVRPRAGSVLIFPQGVGEDEVEEARRTWPTHEGTPVRTGSRRPKYVVRTDLLYGPDERSVRDDDDDDDIVALDPRLTRYDDDVRRAFLPSSPVHDAVFARATAPLYEAVMGVECVGPLLHSLARFVRPRRVVEIGAGYTTLWILRALADNEADDARVAALEREGKARLLDYPWTAPRDDDHDDGGRASLLCVDNKRHQKETATGAAAVARDLGLDDWLEFVEKDAFDLDFEEESVDLLWCDFGVGSRMHTFLEGGAWSAIRPGGFLVCHSTLTNRNTRTWLEAMRRRATTGRRRTRDAKEEDEWENVPTGVPPDEEFAEISFLEPHKRFQNSVSIFQRRGKKGSSYEEPLYSISA